MAFLYTTKRVTMKGIIAKNKFQLRNKNIVEPVATTRNTDSMIPNVHIIKRMR